MIDNNTELTNQELIDKFSSDEYLSVANASVLVCSEKSYQESMMWSTNLIHSS